MALTLDLRHPDNFFYLYIYITIKNNNACDETSTTLQLKDKMLKFKWCQNARFL